MKKDILLRQSVESLKTSKVGNWYEAHLTTKNQAETINELVRAINEKELDSREALTVAFIVGFQWKQDFED